MKPEFVSKIMQSARTMRILINLWPPFLCTGIHVVEIDHEYRHVRVRLRRGLLNRNYVGTHFGGSLFAMADPFWMLLMMRRLGTEYTVWDRAASIEFVTAVRESVYTNFTLSDECVTEVRKACSEGTPVTRWFETDVVTANGKVVARVRKQLHIRLRNARSVAIGAKMDQITLSTSESQTSLCTINPNQGVQ